MQHHEFTMPSKAKYKRDNDARAFLPAALEILDTPPSPTGRLLAALIGLFVILFFAWSSFGQVDIVSVASGKVIPIGRSQVIQSPDTGIVTSIQIKVGQRVKKGDVLIKLDIDPIIAEMNRAKGDLMRAKLDQLRLIAFINETETDPFLNLDGFSLQHIDRARQTLNADRLNMNSKLGGIQREIEQRSAELNTAKEELRGATEILPFVEEKASIRKKSYETTFGSLLLSLEAEQQVVEVKSQQRIAKQKILQAEAALATLMERLNEVRSEAIRAAFLDLSHATAQIDAASEIIYKAERRISLSTLVSPCEGTISQLSIFAAGAVVSNGQQLLTIVPIDQKLEIEAILPNSEVGFVKLGQTAEIKVDAFPFTRYGLIQGKVSNISSDSEPQPTGLETLQLGNTRKADTTANLERSERLVYTVKIEIDEDNQTNQRQSKILLLPGMSVRVEIKTGTRSISSYILSPLTQSLHESFKER